MEIYAHVACNQLGYDCSDVKRATVWFSQPRSAGPLNFSLIDESGRVVLEKPLQPAKTLKEPWRIGTNLHYWVADFSEWYQKGTYTLKVGNSLSYPFLIDDDVYAKVLRMAYRYFYYQRCGMKIEGVHDVCHLDDGVRSDTGQHWDAVGGWHDAGDLRKWMKYHTLAEYVLLQLYECLMSRGEEERAREVLDESLWGNKFFLKMQDSSTGKVFDYCGVVDQDQRWTDNIIGTSDDREIWVSDSGQASIITALRFVASEAAMARIMAEKEPDYARTCLEAARKAWEWIHKPENYWNHVAVYAWDVLAGLELHKATGGSEYLRQAVERANSIVECQEKTLHERYSGLFYTNTDRMGIFWGSVELPTYPILWCSVDAGDPLIALCNIYMELRDEANRREWYNAIQLHTSCLKNISQISPFSLLPTVICLRPLSNEKYEKIGSLYYRFYYPRYYRAVSQVKGFPDERKAYWWVGINGWLLSKCAGLLYAYQVTGDTDLKTLAKAQLDWIFGNNPFKICTMVGVGTNTAMPMSPYSGIIPGGIVNGIGGSADDEPLFWGVNLLNPIDYYTKEYWAVHNAYFLWAISVLRIQKAKL